MELLLQFHVVHIGVVMKKVKKKSVRLTKQQVLPLFGLWSLLVIVFCVWFLFCGLYESWLTYQSRVGIENGIDAFSNENLSRMSFISDKNPRFGSVGTIYQTGNISYILSDSWRKGFGADSSEKSNYQESYGDYTISDGLINYGFLNVMPCDFSIDDPDEFIQSIVQKLNNHSDEDGYKSIFNHITTFDNKPAFEELYTSSNGITYNTYFFANDKPIYIRLWISQNDIEYSKHLVEFYEMLSSIRVEDENIFPLERSDDVYTGSVYSVGKDIDAGRYSLVGYSKDAAYLFLGDNCVVGQKNIPVNDIVNAGSQDVYLVDGMLVDLVSDCALIKYE